MSVLCNLYSCLSFFLSVVTMVGHKLGFSVYARLEQRFYRSALLSPTINMTAWDSELNGVSPFHFLGDSRVFGVYVICLNKIALLHYINRSRKFHHKFTLINGAVINVTCTIESEELGTATFRTFFTGNVDSMYVHQHMNLKLNLPQSQSMVSTYSSREGHACFNCNDPATELPTFKHMTNVEGENDAETVLMLTDVMLAFNRRLMDLGCTLHPKTLRIQSIVESSNIFAGPPCLAPPKSRKSVSEKRSNSNKPTGPAALYKRKRSNSLPVSLEGKPGVPHTTLTGPRNLSLSLPNLSTQGSTEPPTPGPLLDNIIGPKHQTLNILRGSTGGFSDFEKQCYALRDRFRQPSSKVDHDLRGETNSRNIWMRMRIPEKMAVAAPFPSEKVEEESVEKLGFSEERGKGEPKVPDARELSNSKEVFVNDSQPSSDSDFTLDPGAFNQNAQHMLLTQDLWLSDSDNDESHPLVVGSMNDTAPFEPSGSETDKGVLVNRSSASLPDKVTPSDNPSSSLLAELTGNLDSPGKSKKYEKHSIINAEDSGIPAKVSKTRCKLNYYTDSGHLESDLE